MEELIKFVQLGTIAHCIMHVMHIVVNTARPVASSSPSNTGKEENMSEQRKEKGNNPRAHKNRYINTNYKSLQQKQPKTLEHI